MAKQFVTEVRQANSVVILINGVDAKRYNRNPAEFEGYVNPLVADAAEYEEITEGNKVHYWVWVPDLIDTTSTKKIKMQTISPYEKKQQRKFELIRKKQALIEHYAEMFEKHGENFTIEGTDETFKDGAELRSLEKKLGRFERMNRGMNDTILGVKTVF